MAGHFQQFTIANSGNLQANDNVPPTLYPILKRQKNEQLPVLQDSIRALSEWARVQPKGARLKRSLGRHEFTISGRVGERNIMSFSLYRLQRVLDQYAAMSDSDRQRADRFLEAVGGRALSTMKLPVRLERRDYRLVFA